MPTTTTSIIRPELLTLSMEQFNALRPYFWVFGGTLVAIILSVIRFLQPKWPVFILTLATAAAGVCASLGLMKADPVLLFNRMMISDTYSNFFNILFLVSAALTILASFRYLDREVLQYP